MRVSFLVIAAALMVFNVGCCGPMKANKSALNLPETSKAMDQVHEKLAGSGKLYAGAAMVDITPEYPVWMGGFDMGRKSVGVRDPIHVHALYLDDGRKPFVLVAVNTIGLLRDYIKEVIPLATDVHHNSILIGSMHNHVTPDTLGYWGKSAGFLPLCSGTCPNYMETLKYKIAQAIDLAALDAKPATVRALTAQVDPSLSINIHYQVRDEKDDVVRIMAFDDESGKPIATVANWGCHVEALWNDNQISADWAGVYFQKMMAEWGGVPLFVEGALGGLVTINPGDEKMSRFLDIDVIYKKYMTIDERIEVMNRVGNGLATAVLDALNQEGEKLGPAGIEIHQAKHKFEMQQDNWVFNYMGNRGMLNRKTEWRKGKTYITTETVGMRLKADGKTLLDLVSVPGEPTPPLVAAIDATSDAPVKFTVALGNDENGYIILDSEWDARKYTYERTMSLGKETGAKVFEAVEKVRAMLPAD